MKMSVGFAIRAVSGLTLLVMLLRQLEWPVLLAAFQKVPIWVWVITVILAVLATFISSIKLAAFLNILNTHVALPRVFTVYMTGLFLGNFLPGTVGGDAVKYGYLRLDVRNRTSLLMAIFAERFFGAAVLVLMGAGGMAVVSELRSIPGLALGMAALALLAIVALAMARKAPGESASTGEEFKSLKGVARQKWMRAHAALHLLACSNSALWAGFWTSFLFVVDGVLVTYLFLHALGQHLSLVYVLAATCAVQIATMVPISINGIGVREWAYVVLLGYFEVPAETATAVSLMVYASVLLSSLPGAVFYIFKSGRPQAHQR